MERILIEEHPEELIRKIKGRHESRLKNPEESYFKETTPVIITGHQPIFYHPGILIKDLLAVELARVLNGRAFNLIVDTDEEDIELRLPVSTGRGTLGRESFQLSPRGVALRGRQIDPAIREALLRRLGDYRREIYRIFTPAAAPRIQDGVEMMIAAFEESREICDPGVKLREIWEKSNGIRIETIYAGEITRTEMFDRFKERIAGDADRFRKIYNRALTDYRSRHRIKNTAQPLPDLHEGELPFWLVRNGKRSALPQGAPIHDPDIYPRAVTLTLFCRMYMADAMIHGTGGGRYDQITDRIIEEFFEIQAAPFTVATATLSLEVRADIPVETRPIRDIEREIRAVRFDPSRFLPVDHELSLEKQSYVERMNRPGFDRSSLHEKITDVNRRILPLIEGARANLIREHERSRIVIKNRRISQDRTFPFIFYNISPLFETVRNISLAHN